MKTSKTPQERSIDPASIEMLEHSKAEGLTTVWDRYEAMQPQCLFGIKGICCKNCSMGPCRISLTGKGATEGICGATADVIAARNLVRMIATGSSAHSDHARDVVTAMFHATAEEGSDYQVKNPEKLASLAAEWGVDTEGKSVREIGHAVSEVALSQFGQQFGELKFISRAPEAQQARWREAGVVPAGIDREVVTLLHSTHVGGDSDARNLILSGIRAALGDGWGGSMIATELQDILFQSPAWLKSRSNLGVIDPKKVNIVVHGHEPILSEMLVAASNDPELLELAKSKGAEGVQLSGICCTANEILMRHGIPVAGNFLQQELAIATGAVDAMIVDIQCVMPAVGTIAEKFHTKLISTSKKAKFPKAKHIELDEANALNIAKDIIKESIENFSNRETDKVKIPDVSSPLVAGFTAENIFTALGGRYRPSYRPLNDAIISGRLRGVAAVVGCNNPRYQQDAGHVAMTRELLKNDVLVATTGCTAIADAKAGLLCPESAAEFAGQGIREVCDAVGIPPVLHLGACVDISRILVILGNVVKEGGLGDDFAGLPIAAAAPEWMSEKAIAIGFYAVASGAFTVLGEPLPVEGAPGLKEYLTDGIAADFGGKFAFECDPIKAAHLMIDHIDAQREALHLSGPMYPVPYQNGQGAKVAAGTS